MVKDYFISLSSILVCSLSMIFMQAKVADFEAGLFDLGITLNRKLLTLESLTHVHYGHLV